MNWNKRVGRPTGSCPLLTAAVIINIVAIAQKKYANDLGFLAVFPLAFLR